MGTASYVLAGTERAMKESAGSACHGAGRVMSRKAAVRKFRADQLVRELGSQGIYVRAASKLVVAEEAPGSYKDVSQVVDTVHGAGLAHKVARMEPLGVVKG
jgi:tRNA-splicing ligase RtcB